MQNTTSPLTSALPFTFPRPSDFHQHYRWGAMLKAVAPHNMRHIKYGLAMPNNGPGEGGIVRTTTDALQVYHAIMDVRAQHRYYRFDGPILTLYHTADVTPDVVTRIARSRFVRAIKDYPAHGGTTNSGHGLPFDANDALAKACLDMRVRRLFHAEDVVDLQGNPLPHALREAHCIKERLWRFRDRFPGLICLEHASTREAIEFVKADTSGNTVMTVTPQHLLFTEEDFGRYSWKNHLRCMPYVKTEDDRQALLEFVTSGDPRCIAGSDTAPHPSILKNKPFEEAACGCWTPHAIALYALAFAQRGALDERFVKFMSLNGPDWWQLPRPTADDTITIRAIADGIPDPTPLPETQDVIIPLGWATEPDRYKLEFAL